MAYRFLLEVPERLAAEAGIAVGEAADAQVVVVRNAHGRPADDPFFDLTVAAHSLRVIGSIYSWYGGLSSPRPDIHIVLHSGERMPLVQHQSGDMVAAIRRDQPWVERTIPKIGEHEADSFAAPQETAVTSTLGTPNASTTTLERSWRNVPALQEPAGGRKVEIRELNHVALRVTDLEVAERFYGSFLSMEVVGRARRNADGSLESLDSTYSWADAKRAGQEADVSFMRNGPLVIALQRLGRGARLERGLLDHLSIRVDAATFTVIKSQVLMRSMEVIGSEETAFAFRDPLGITWEIALQSVPEFI